MNQFQPQFGGPEFRRVESTLIEWPRRFFTFSVVLCGLLALITIGLRFFYSPYLAEAIKEKDKELLALASQIPDADREGFITFYSQLLNLKSALQNHRVAGGLFSWLEHNTNAAVTVQKLNFTTRTNTLIVDGLASSYKSLSEQLAVLQTLPEVSRYSVDQSQVTDRGIQFKLAIVLSETISRPQ